MHTIDLCPIGPFSFALQQELKKLQQAHIISSSLDNKSWILQHASISDYYLPASIRRDIAQILETYRTLPVKKLIDTVYQKYPWFTLNSKEKQRKTSRPQTTIAIYTIGYEQLSIDDFLNRILKNGIRHVIELMCATIRWRADMGFTIISLVMYLSVTIVENHIQRGLRIGN